MGTRPTHRVRSSGLPGQQRSFFKKAFLQETSEGCTWTPLISSNSCLGSLIDRLLTTVTIRIHTSDGASAKATRCAKRVKR